MDSETTWSKIVITVLQVDSEHVAGLNRIMGSQLSPIDNWIFNGNTYINNR